MIILLDLNYTLADNSEHRMSAADYGTFVDQHETYRRWLVELIRPHTVIMMTARPETWRDRTLARIMAVTAWQPTEAHFNQMGTKTPAPKVKLAMLQRSVFPQHGRPAGQYLALESNKATRAMYERQGIQAIAVPTAGEWSKLPELQARPGSMF